MSRRLSLDDLPPAYRAQAERQLNLIDSARSAALEAATNFVNARKRVRLEEQEEMSKSSGTTRSDRGVLAPSRGPRQPNKTEARFNREVLFGSGQYEALTFHLPGGSKYTPDFVEWLFDPQTQQAELVVYEVKGSYRFPSENRALTAFREARAAFPHVTFRWFRLQKGGTWKEEHQN